MLDVARVHRKRLESFKLGDAGLDPDAWLCMVGIDSTTRVRLHIKRAGGKPIFDLTSDDRRNDWEDPNPARRVFSGDGTVPYLGAEPSFLARKNLVCLRPDDFGYWEIGDRTLLKMAGFHAMLPSLNLAHRLVVSHFRGKMTKGIWGRPAPEIPTSEWEPPIKGLEPKE